MADKKKIPFLGKVQKTYIRAHMNSISAQEIAKDLKQPVVLVERQIAQFREEDGEKPPTPPVQGAGAAARRVDPAEECRGVSMSTGEKIPGVTVLTPRQSQLNDEATGSSPFSCGVVTEAQRQYLKNNADKLSVAQLATDTGLTTFMVRDVLGQLTAPEIGRKEFLERNRKHIHVIEEGKPIR
jgi:hypothetical protein